MFNNLSGYHHVGKWSNSVIVRSSGCVSFQGNPFWLSLKGKPKGSPSFLGCPQKLTPLAGELKWPGFRWPADHSRRSFWKAEVPRGTGQRSASGRSVSHPPFGPHVFLSFFCFFVGCSLISLVCVEYRTFCISFLSFVCSVYDCCC